jgi:uncharacterized membrane protein
VESRAKLFGHAVHPILVVFPAGLLITAVIFDAVYLVTRYRTWTDASFWMIAVGIVAGLAAAVPGLIDLLAIPPGTRAQTVALWHAGGNVLALMVFGVSWLLRCNTSTQPQISALVLSFFGAVLLVFTGWLGGELVERLGVGVDDGAHLDSPSSLSGRPAGANATRETLHDSSHEA